MTQPPIDSSSLPAHPGHGERGPAPYGPTDIPPSTTRATWALVLCLIPTTLTNIIGFILCIVVLVDRDDPRNGGRGRAVAGLVVSGVYVVLVVLVLVILSIAVAIDADSSAESDDPSRDTETSTTTFFVDLRAGDCLQDVVSEGEVSTVEVVPCRRPHRGQVTAVFSLPRGDWPGEDRIQRVAERRCRELGDRNAPGRAARRLQPTFAYPVESTWDTDRSVQCILEGARRTGSVVTTR